MNDYENSDNVPEFVLPDAPPENYRSVLHMRNAARMEADKAEPKMIPEPMIGCCGENCRDCEYFIEDKVCRSHDGIGCKGCAVDGNSCEIRLCCIGKGFSDCGECEAFPCDMLKASSKDEDAENLLFLKAKHDKAVVKHDRIVGSLTAGAALGLVLGIFAGAFTGLMFQFAVCGVLAGVGIAVLVNMGRKK